MNIIAKVNWIDVLIVILMLRISYVAFQEGLSHNIFPVFGNIATLFLTLHYYNRLAAVIVQNFNKISPEISNFLCFLALMIAIGLPVRFLIKFLDKIVKIQWHPMLDRFGGLAFGAARAAIVTTLVLTIIALTPFPYMQRSIRDRSLTGTHFLRIGPAVHDRVLGLFQRKRDGESRTERKRKMLDELVRDKSILQKTKSSEKKRREWEEP